MLEIRPIRKCALLLCKRQPKSQLSFFSFLGLKADDVIIGDMILTHEQYEIMYGKGKEIEIIHMKVISSELLPIVCT